MSVFDVEKAIELRKQRLSWVKIAQIMSGDLGRNLSWMTVKRRVQEHLGSFDVET